MGRMRRCGWKIIYTRALIRCIHCLSRTCPLQRICSTWLGAKISESKPRLTRQKLILGGHLELLRLHLLVVYLVVILMDVQVLAPIRSSFHSEIAREEAAATVRKLRPSIFPMCHLHNGRQGLQLKLVGQSVLIMVEVTVTVC